MRIKEIVNKNLIAIDINTTIYDAANVMKKYNIGFLPVFSNKKIMGVITDRDIVVNCVASNSNIDQKIEDYINKNIISIDWNREIREALNLMKINKVKRVIIADSKKIIGVLSLSDILETNEKNTLETIKSIWQISNKEKLKDAEIDEFYL